MTDPQPTKDRIRREALRLFAAQGIGAVSVRDIASAVGMSPPNLYAHYKGRDALVADLFVTGFAEYGRRLATAAAGPGPFPERLEAMVRLICRLQREDADLFRFLLLTQHANLPVVDASLPTNPVQIVQDTVAAAMAAGEIPPGDPVLITAAIIGIVLQAAVFRHYGRLSRDLDASAGEIVALVLKAIL